MDHNEPEFERHTVPSNIERFEDSQATLEEKVANMDTKFTSLYNLIQNMIPSSSSKPLAPKPPTKATDPKQPSSSK